MCQAGLLGDQTPRVAPPAMGGVRGGRETALAQLLPLEGAGQRKQPVCARFPALLGLRLQDKGHFNLTLAVGEFQGFSSAVLIPHYSCCHIEQVV